MKQCGLGAYQEKTVEHLGEEVIMEYKEAATLSGRLDTTMVAARTRRSLWLVESYPVAFLRLLRPGGGVASRCFVVGSTHHRHTEASKRAPEALQRGTQMLAEKTGFALDAPLAAKEAVAT